VTVAGRGGGKKDVDAIALAGSVAAKAVYDALEGGKAEEKKDLATKDSPAPVVKDVPRRLEPLPRREDDDLVDAMDDLPPVADDLPPSSSSPSSRQLTTPPGRRLLGGRTGGFTAGGSGYRGRPLGRPFEHGQWQPQAPGERDYKSSDDFRQVLDTIPKNERASVLFKFRQRRMVGSGKVMFRPIMEWNAVGDPAEWQARIRSELAQRGPGLYEGIPHTTEGRPIPDETHWMVEIKEEEAREAGWLPDEEKEKPVNMPVVTAPQQPSNASAADAGADDDDMEKLAKREKARIDYLKNQLECTKIENQLAAEREGGKKAPVQETVSMPKDVLTEQAAQRLVDAEKARLAAEHKAEMAKIEAERKAEVARLEADREKAEARLKSDIEAERRKAEDQLKDLKNEMARKETEHANKLADLQRGLEKQFEDKFKGLEKTLKDQEKDRERDKHPERKPEETAVAVATALSQAFSPILTPIMNALATKMTTPPPAPVVPAPPDPTKQIAEIGKIFQPFLERLANPPAPPPPPPAQPAPDPMAIVEKTMGLVKEVLPKQERAPRAEELAEAVARAVESRLPQQPQQPQQDPFQLADKVMNYAKGLAELNGGRGGDSGERDEPMDPLEVAEKTFDRLKKFGVPITIGTPQAAPAVEPPKPNLVGEIFAGVKETLPAFGDAVAKYMNSRQPQVDPNLLREFQIAQLKKKTEMRRKPAPGAPRQPQQQRPGAQRPVVPQQQFGPQPQPAPQPQPTAVVPPQPRPVVHQQPAQPQPAPRPAQAPAAPATNNRFVPPGAGGTEPYNIPTVMIHPLRPSMAKPTPPVESVPQRAAVAPQASQKPVEHIPAAAPGQAPTNGQAAGPAARIPAQMIPQRPQQRAPQAPSGFRPSQRPFTPPQRPQAVRPTAPTAPAAPAAPAPAVAPIAPAPQQAVARPQQPAPQPVAQSPVAPAQGEIAAEDLDAEGMPTMQVWAELATYACAAIDKNEDTDLAALYLLERFPKASALVRNVVETMNVEALDALLVNYSHNAGPHAEVLGNLASKIRNQGKDWTLRLVSSLKGSSVGTEAAG
jgi:hypothetical protein